MERGLLSLVFVSAGMFMSIKVRYFASLKESLNRSEEELAFTTPLTVREVWQCANAGKPLPPHILAAVNMD